MFFNTVSMKPSPCDGASFGKIWTCGKPHVAMSAQLSMHWGIYAYRALFHTLWFNQITTVILEGYSSPDSHRFEAMWQLIKMVKAVLGSEWQAVYVYIDICWPLIMYISAICWPLIFVYQIWYQEPIATCQVHRKRLSTRRGGTAGVKLGSKPCSRMCSNMCFKHMINKKILCNQHMYPFITSTSMHLNSYTLYIYYIKKNIHGHFQTCCNGICPNKMTHPETYKHYIKWHVLSESTGL